VGFHQPAAHQQSQPQAPGAIGAVLFQALERREQPGLVGAGDAGAAVADADDQVVVLGAGGYLYPALRRRVLGGIFQQIEKIITPLGKSGVTWWEIFSGVTIVIGVASVLIYFFFSVEHKGIVNRISRLGIYFVMIAFGASFGYTVMARMSLLIGRSYDLIEFATPKYYYATIVLLVLMVLILVLYESTRKKEDGAKDNA